MAKCIYTEQELDKLLRRANDLFVIECNNLENLIAKSIADGFEHLLFNSLGKSLKAVDMYRTQIIHLESLKRRFYFHEKKDEE